MVKFYVFVLTLGMMFGGLTLSAQNQLGSAPPDFKGRLLLALSDADMAASAYIDGKLLAPNGKDELSVISFREHSSAFTKAVVTATNSVVGPPASLAVSSDGKYAIVIETRGPRPERQPEATFKDLAKGHAITVIDLSNPSQPQVVQRLNPPGEQPLSVCINPAGDLVAIAYTTLKIRQSPLVLYRFRRGKLSAPFGPVIPNWGKGDD